MWQMCAFYKARNSYTPGTNQIYSEYIICALQFWVVCTVFPQVYGLRLTTTSCWSAESQVVLSTSSGGKC